MEIALAEAKARLSELVDRAVEGESVCITRRGKLVAQIVPIQQTTTKKPIDVEALRAAAAKLPYDPEPAGEFIRRMRDEDRY